MNPRANRIKHAIRHSAWLVLLAGLLVLPAVSLAQQATETPTATAEPTSAGSLAITTIQPDTLINDVAVELVVTGRGFVDGSVVVINNFGGLETVFVSGSVLRATVPPGLSPGRYTVKVVNPDAATAELPEALKIVLPAGPTNTPEPSPTPAPTDFVRPLLVVASYGASAPQITPGQNLDFEMTLANAGQAPATNVVATFSSGDFVSSELFAHKFIKRQIVVE